MKNEQRQPQDEGKLVKLIKDHINQDIEMNKKVNGIDFSTFLSAIITSCTGKKIFIGRKVIETKEEDNFFSLQLNLGLNYIAEQLSNEYNKMIQFMQSEKIPAGVMHISDRDKLEELDNYARQLYTRQLPRSEQDREINSKAIRYLTHFIKYGE